MDPYGQSQQYGNPTIDYRLNSDQSGKFNAPFAQTYMQRNYDHFQGANQPQVLNLQQNQTVLNQLNNPSFRGPATMQSQVDRDGLIYQNHVMKHPQIKEMIHRDQPITVVSREDIESVWKNKCNQLQLALTEVQTEVMRIRGVGGMSDKVTYVEDTIKLNQLYLEIDRLNKCLLDLSLELDSWKNRYNQLENRGKRQYTEVDIDQMRTIMLENESVLNSEISRLRSDLDEWQKRYRIIELSLSEHRGQEGTLKDYDQKTSQLRQDIDRLNIALNHKNIECEEFRQKYIRIEVQLRENATLEVELRRVKELLDTRNREIEVLRHHQGQSSGKDQQISQMEIELLQANDELQFRAKQISDLKLLSQSDNRLSNLQDDFSRLNLDLKDREQEIIRLKNQIITSEGVERRYNELQKDHAILQQQINQSRGSELKITQLNEQIINLQSTIRQLNYEVEDLKNNLDAQDQQLSEATQSSERVTILVSEVETWKRKFIELNREYHKNQEDYIMCQAELDSLKNKRLQVPTTTTQYKQDDNAVRSSAVRQSGASSQFSGQGYQSKPY